MEMDTNPPDTEKTPLLGSVGASRNHCSYPPSPTSSVGHFTRERTHLNAIVDVESNEISDPQLSGVEAFIHIVKGNLGTGLLGLPFAFARSGIVVGIIFMGTIGFLATYCMRLLVRCSHQLCKQNSVAYLDYGRLGEQAVKNLPGHLSDFGHVARFFINLFLCITQLGFCCVYVLFVSLNLQQVLEACDVHVSYRLLILILLPLFIVGSYVRELKTMAPLSLVANFLQVLSVILLLQYLVRYANWHNVKTWPESSERVFMFFGLAVFSVEGIGVVLPLDSNMKQPQRLGGIIWLAMAGVVSLYTFVGVFGYAKYGDSVKGSVTLSLPTGGQVDNLLYVFIKLFYTASIFLSYFLQLYVAMTILEEWLMSCSVWYKESKLSTYVLRTALVCASAAVAAGVPHLGLLISLFGALSSSMVALIFPPLIAMATFWNNSLSVGEIIWYNSIALFGFFGMIVGLYSTIQQF